MKVKSGRGARETWHKGLYVVNDKSTTIPPTRRLGGVAFPPPVVAPPNPPPIIGSRSSWPSADFGLRSGRVNVQVRPPGPAPWYRPQRPGRPAFSAVHLLPPLSIRGEGVAKVRLNRGRRPGWPSLLDSWPQLFRQGQSLRRTRTGTQRLQSAYSRPFPPLSCWWFRTEDRVSCSGLRSEE